MKVGDLVKVSAAGVRDSIGLALEGAAEIESWIGIIVDFHVDDGPIVMWNVLDRPQREYQNHVKVISESR